MSIYTSHSPFNVGNSSLFVCLHGCAVAFAHIQVISWTSKILKSWHLLLTTANY